MQIWVVHRMSNRPINMVRTNGYHITDTVIHVSNTFLECDERGRIQQTVAGGLHSAGSLPLDTTGISTPIHVFLMHHSTTLRTACPTDFTNRTPRLYRTNAGLTFQLYRCAVEPAIHQQQKEIYRHNVYAVQSDNETSSGYSSKPPIIVLNK
jgi:hypothetical protein